MRFSFRAQVISKLIKNRQRNCAIGLVEFIHCPNELGRQIIYGILSFHYLTIE